MRLDQYLVQHGFVESRARAKETIDAELVRIDGRVARRAAQNVTDNCTVDIIGQLHDYVSRGGVKLEAALKNFSIRPDGCICLDLGASTGGFTEVLLRAGAQKVYAVDVGTDQLHRRVSEDPRVVNMEKTHAKSLNSNLISAPIDIIVCDVSFISLKKALPPALALAAPGARLVALVKPQFEVGRSRIGKGGIVNPGYANSEGVAEEISRWLASLPGWLTTGLMESPISGGDGNKEFLLSAVYNP